MYVQVTRMQETVYIVMGLRSGFVKFLCYCYYSVVNNKVS